MKCVLFNEDVKRFYKSVCLALEDTIKSLRDSNLIVNFANKSYTVKSTTILIIATDIHIFLDDARQRLLNVIHKFRNDQYIKDFDIKFKHFSTPDKKDFEINLYYIDEEKHKVNITGANNKYPNLEIIIVDLNYYIKVRTGKNEKKYHAASVNLLENSDLSIAVDCDGSFNRAPFILENAPILRVPSYDYFARYILKEYANMLDAPLYESLGISSFRLLNPIMSVIEYITDNLCPINNKPINNIILPPNNDCHIIIDRTNIVCKTCKIPLFGKCGLYKQTTKIYFPICVKCMYRLDMAKCSLIDSGINAADILPELYQWVADNLGDQILEIFLDKLENPLIKDYIKNSKCSYYATDDNGNNDIFLVADKYALICLEYKSNKDKYFIDLARLNEGDKKYEFVYMY